MANYIEQKNLFNDSELKNRCEAAVINAAVALLKSSPTAETKALVKKVFNQKAHYADLALHMLVITHSEKTVEQIQVLTDEDIQTVVDVAAPLIEGM